MIFHSEEKTIELYGQLCAVYILSDHDRLNDLLSKEPQVSLGRMRKNLSKSKAKSFGF